MSEGANLLFPLILDALSHKPLLSETQHNLLEDLKKKMNSEGIRVGNLKKELDVAIDIGRSLGILTVQEEEVRMPFIVNADSSNTATSRSKSAPGSDENKQKRETGNKGEKNGNNSEDEQKRVYRSHARSRSHRRSRTRSRSRRRRSHRGRRRR